MCVKPLLGLEDYVTSLHAANHSDDEACAVIKRQVDVEDVLGCDSAYRLNQAGGPNPLMGDNGSFR